MVNMLLRGLSPHIACTFLFIFAPPQDAKLLGDLVVLHFTLKGHVDLKDMGVACIRCCPRRTCRDSEPHGVVPDDARV